MDNYFSLIKCILDGMTLYKYVLIHTVPIRFIYLLFTQCNFHSRQTLYPIPPFFYSLSSQSTQSDKFSISFLSKVKHLRNVKCTSRNVFWEISSKNPLDLSCNDVHTQLCFSKICWLLNSRIGKEYMIIIPVL